MLQLWLNGDRDAGSQLFEKHAPSVRRFVAQRTNRNVDDLVQRTFVTCMLAGRRYRGDGNVRAFLLGIARNELSAEWRSRKRQCAALVQWEREASSGEDETRVELDETYEPILLEALRSLPIALRIPLELLYWEHLSRAEIARRLDVPEGTVASRVRVAHRHLRRLLVRAQLRASALR